MNAPDYGQLLTDLLPAREPPKYLVHLTTDCGSSQHLISTAMPGDAVDTVFDTIGPDEKFVAITVELSTMWIRWRKAMDEQLEETQLRG